jgi:hypothetical protein
VCGRRPYIVLDVDKDCIKLSDFHVSSTVLRVLAAHGTEEAGSEGWINSLDCCGARMGELVLAVFIVHLMDINTYWFK